jgi:iron complex outermembrane receptor protein
LSVSHHLNSRDEIEGNLNEIDLGLLQNHTFYNLRIAHRISQKVNQNIGLQGSYIKSINKVNVQEILNPDAKVFENGIYYLIDFDLNKYFIQAGVRYDYRFVEADASAQHLIDYGFTLVGNPENRKLTRSFQGMTGSLGISRRIKDFNTLKLNFSTGYRAPDIAELFSNGPHPGTNRFEMGNADFKREQSFQADLGWILKSSKFSVNSSVFVNFIQNYIFFAATDKLTPSELEIWEFNQANGLLYGGEVSINYFPLNDEKLILSANAALVRGKRTDISENLTFIPADNYRLYISSKPIEKLKLYFHSTLKYVAQHKNPGFGEANTDDYFLWSMGVNHTFDFNQHKMSLGLSVFNLLNNTYFDHMSILRAFEVTSPGRNFMVNLQYNF